MASWDLAPGVDGKERFVSQLTGDIDDARFAERSPLLKSSLEPSTQYTLRVGTADPTTVIGDADFTGADLEHLRPGSVLIADLAEWDTDKQDYAPTMIVSRKKFDEPRARMTTRTLDETPVRVPPPNTSIRRLRTLLL